MSRKRRNKTLGARALTMKFHLEKTRILPTTVQKVLRNGKGQSSNEKVLWKLPVISSSMTSSKTTGSLTEKSTAFFESVTSDLRQAGDSGCAHSGACCLVYGTFHVYSLPSAVLESRCSRLRRPRLTFSSTTPKTFLIYEMGMCFCRARLSTLAGRHAKVRHVRHVPHVSREWGLEATRSLQTRLSVRSRSS